VKHAPKERERREEGEEVFSDRFKEEKQSPDLMYNLSKKKSEVR
jgi:hypothetical protein